MTLVEVSTSRVVVLHLLSIKFITRRYSTINPLLTCYYFHQQVPPQTNQRSQCHTEILDQVDV